MIDINKYFFVVDNIIENYNENIVHRRINLKFLKIRYRKS